MNRLPLWFVLFVLGCGLFAAEPAVQANFPGPGRIFFNSDFSGNQELYVLEPKGLTRLTQNTHTDEWPVPDRQGKRLLFAANPSGNFDIFLMELDTRRVRRLTQDAGDEQSPMWSAEADIIYFHRRVGKNNWESLRMDLRNGAVTPLFPELPFRGSLVPFPSPDGKQIFFTAKVLFGWLVARFDTATRTYRKLTGSGACRPKVSPDGRRVAFVSDAGDGHGDVFLMNPDGGDKVNLTAMRPQFYDYYPCFSPDGQRLVFSSSPIESGKNEYQLYIIDRDGRNCRRIFRAPGNSQYPFWGN